MPARRIEASGCIGPRSILHINRGDILQGRFPTWNSSYFTIDEVVWGDWVGWSEVSNPDSLVTYSDDTSEEGFLSYVAAISGERVGYGIIQAPFRIFAGVSGALRLAYMSIVPWEPVRSSDYVSPWVGQYPTTLPSRDPLVWRATITQQHNAVTAFNTTTGDTIMPINLDPAQLPDIAGSVTRPRDALGRFARTYSQPIPTSEWILQSIDYATTTEAPAERRLRGSERIARPEVSWHSPTHYGGTCPHCLGEGMAHCTSDTLGNVCADCFRTFHISCDSCGITALLADAEGSSDWHYHPSSWGAYWRCDYCENTSDDDEADDDQYDMGEGPQWTNAARELLVGYHHRPRLKFTDWAGDDHGLVFDERLEKGDHRLFMGVELETELMRAPSAYDVINKVLNGRRDDLDLFQAKTDGSLSNGIEFVSMPLTIDAWRHLDLGWMQDIANMGVRCWDTTTAGLHVHCSVSAFKTRSHFVRWWMLYEKNPQQWVKLAGRHNKQYAKWDREIKRAAVSRAFKMMPLDVYDSPNAPKAPDYNRGTQREIERAEFERRLWAKYHPNKLPQKATSNGDRYVALNAQNEHTVEQRFWRPSLRHTTLLATLEAIQASFDYTYQLGELNSKAKMIDKIELLHWDHFRAWVKAHSEDYPYLDARIALRFKEDGGSDIDPTDK